MHSFAQPAGGYNAACDLVGRNLDAGRGGKEAFRDPGGSCSYAELGERIDRFASCLGALGIRQEERVVLCLHDTIDFPCAFLGAIKAGVIPVPINTRLAAQDYRFILEDSRARALVVSADLADKFPDATARHPHLAHVLVSGGSGERSLAAALSSARSPAVAASTVADDMCFWLYSSGTTGAPKGVVHLHSHLGKTAELYAGPILGIDEHDVVYSAAKLFFAYGLGNALTFSMAAGATAVLFPGHPSPDAVWDVLAREQPTLFFAVPTLYAGLLAASDKPGRDKLALRLCVSAGEALPPDLGRRWQAHTGLDILDGIGSTEMLHIFLTNRPGHVRYGTTGKPVPGYRVRIIGEDGAECRPGEIGELQVSGPTSAVMYWNQRDKSRATFAGEWTRCGDKYRQTEDGYFVYCGRTDDMLKVSGIWVSPFEVEAALASHPRVREAAVVGREDENGLVKPQAFVILHGDADPSEELRRALKEHVKTQLAAYKYPRWIEFVAELPKTATGKIQRYKLRERARHGGAASTSDPAGQP